MEEDWTVIGQGGKPFKLSLIEFPELVVAASKGKPVQEVERKICRTKKVKLSSRLMVMCYILNIHQDFRA